MTPTRRLLLGVFMVVLLAGILPVSAQGSATVITTARLRLRAAPDTSAAVLALIPNNARLLMSGMDTSRTWANVIYNGTSGWVSANYLRVISEAPTQQPSSIQPIPQPVTLVYFYADWCEYCAEQRPILDGLVAVNGGRVNLIAYDLDDRSAQAQVSAYGIGYVPVTILLDRNGREVARYDGLTGSQLIQADIDAALR